MDAPQNAAAFNAAAVWLQQGDLARARETLAQPLFTTVLSKRCSMFSEHFSEMEFFFAPKEATWAFIRTGAVISYVEIRGPRATLQWQAIIRPGNLNGVTAAQRHFGAGPGGEQCGTAPRYAGDLDFYLEQERPPRYTFGRLTMSRGRMQVQRLDLKSGAAELPERFPTIP